MGKPTDLVQGTLDLLILRTLELEPKHGWAIAKRIQQLSNEVLKVQQGSLYPALYRIEKEICEKNLEGEAKQRVRGEKSKTLVAEFFEWLKTELVAGALLPKDPFTKAANSATVTSCTPISKSSGNATVWTRRSLG